MTLRRRLGAGDALLGAWIQVSGAPAVELLSSVGFDWIGIDTQHGLVSPEALLGMLRATAGVPAVVRVPSCDTAQIGRALDWGAEGVVVPGIEDPEAAATAVAACRYPPAGTRSWGALRASWREPDYTPALGDARAACIVMIESVAGVRRAAEIFAVPGIDAVYIGPADLAISAGLPPTLVPTDPAHRELVEAIVDACRSGGVPVGMHAPGADRVRDCLAGGMRLLSVYLDGSALRGDAGRRLAAARLHAI